MVTSASITLRRIVSRALDCSTFCPVFAPWNHRRATPEMRTVHCLAAKHVWGRHARARRLVAKIVFASLWPLSSAFYAVAATAKFGSEIREGGGPWLGRQLLDQMILAWRDFIPPPEYYRYCFYVRENRERASDYLFDHEAAALLELINGYPDASVVGNKSKFEDICAAQGLPVARRVAEFRDGEMLPSALREID
jgi:hypothetical protein